MTLAISLPLVSFAVPRDQKVKPTKNVILMIADGTSLSTVSLARWYQRLQDPSQIYLNLDPYISGTILTYSSNAPIGDSAPTTSAYMNGMPSITGFVGTYPYSDGANDLIPVDSTMAYRPLMSLWEATALTQGRRVGLVVTAEFPHATPADCIAHSYKRSRYEWIAKQMVNHKLDIMMGGGVDILTPALRARLEERGYGVFTDDINALDTYKGRQMWCLYTPRDIPYDIDRDATKVPSLAQMTRSALSRLDGEEGFVLMIEGSKIDWAAHTNDPVGMATETLAFDQAVGVALDFAKADGNTVVIITSDHGNSGFSIGNGNLKDYDKTSAQELFGALTSIKLTYQGMANLLLQTPEEKIAEVFEENASFPLTEQQLRVVTMLRRVETKTISKDKLSSVLSAKELEEINNILYAESLMGYIASIYREHMNMGFTTHGHTGEEVFLAVYAPTPEQRLMGFHTNIELHEYMRELLGLDRTMLEYTDEYFAPHDRVFEGCKYIVKGEKPEDKVLTVKKGRKTLEIPAFSSKIMLNGQAHEIAVPAVYVDKTDLFYLPTSLKDLLQ